MTNHTDFIEVDYENLAVAWHDGQRYNPATRHRRRIILELIKQLDFKSVIEIGCGQPYLLQAISASRQDEIECIGTDVSKALISANKKEFPGFKFSQLDIVNHALPEHADLVIASEVLEHVDDYHKALANMAKMANKYIIITVPSSPRFPIDRAIGHYRHYAPEDMIGPLEKLGFETKVWMKWGFPFHNLYKYAINSISPANMRETFAESEYTGIKKLVANAIYYLFFLNLSFWGFQLVILAERKKGR